MNLSDIVILNIESADCCCILRGITKSYAINLLRNIDLTKKAEHYKTEILLSLTFGNIENEKNTYFLYLYRY